MMKRIILASQSPRRKELLAQMGVQFDAVPSGYDERLDDSRATAEVAKELALGKAMDVAEQYPDCIVIGSDTIVTVDDRQLEKPRDKREAHEILKLLSGRPNYVTTGVAVVCLADGTRIVEETTTQVVFRPYDADVVARYVETGDSLDKAGAYGIQSGAAPLISHIKGDYDTVIGLPTALLADMLNRIGVDATPVRLAAPVEQRSMSERIE